MLRPLLTTILVVTWPSLILGQTPVSFDLAARPLGETIVIPKELSGSIAISVHNALPNRSRYAYRVQIAAVPLTIDPFDPPQVEAAFAPPPACDPPGQAARTRAVAALTTLRESEREATVPSRLEAARTAVAAVPDECGKQAIEASYDELGEATAITLDPIEIPSGQVVTITITRVTYPTAAGEGGGEVTSTYRYDAPPRGEWRVQYGFTFLADLFFRNQSFITSPGTAEGTFTIRQTPNREWLHFAPTISYTWLSRQASDRRHSWVMGAGLGFDTSKPVVLLAPLGMTFRRNLTIQVGVALASVDRLLSRYEVDEVIKDNLTPAQLTQSVYRVNPFLSVVFGFGSNPFAQAPQSGTPPPP